MDTILSASTQKKENSKLVKFMHIGQCCSQDHLNGDQVKTKPRGVQD